MSIRDGRYAAIDIGTVTCRMLVADVCDARIIPVAKEYAVTNLGEGVDATGTLKPEAIARVLAAIDVFIAIRDSLDVPESPLVSTSVMATSASRDATNAAEFAIEMESRGLPLSIIPGSQEARLSFMGATLPLAKVAKGAPVMVVDVGGGSTEVSIGPAGESPVISRSFDIGCRRVTERFLRGYPPSAQSLDYACEWMRSQLYPWFQQASEKADLSDLEMIAVAGTATSIVSMRESMEVYDSDRVDGSIVTQGEVSALVGDLMQMSLPEIEGIVGLDPRRAPVITAGALILAEVMRAARIPQFTVSESDILQGMIMYNAGM